MLVIGEINISDSVGRVPWKFCWYQSPPNETDCGYNMTGCGEDMTEEDTGQSKALYEILSHLFINPYTWKNLKEEN
jgi:hypothetical protein